MKKFLLFVFIGYSTLIQAQTERKVSFVGGARSFLNSNTLVVNDSLADTTTVKKNNGGYALIDFGVNIKPNKNTEILGMFRIRNDYGGFWGSGVNFDVRQLWVKGVVANALRYQLGDINLKQTPFTLYNHHADQIDSLPSVFGLQQNIVNYERFYKDNHSWRMQGADIDFGFTFSKYLKEINVNAFINRLNATNFSTVPDRLMDGIGIQLIQSNKLQLGYFSNNVFDVKGTIAGNNIFKNNVNTFTLNLKQVVGTQELSLNGEAGTSNYHYSADSLAPQLNDYFINVYGDINITKLNLKATLGYLNVGPDFRSIGAQSKDINYNALPTYFNRYTNSQQVRPITLFDVIGNENIYNRTVTSPLMPESKIFNTILPYGIATFNRVGMYCKVLYRGNKGLALNGEYFNLSEIRGQGSFALRKYSIVKFNVNIPVNRYINSKKTLTLQLSTNLQATNRKSNESIENADYKTTQYVAGFRWEFISNFELLGGFISQTNKGFDFIADRNGYTEVIYYTLTNYSLTQQIKAVGIRYNFSSKAYLCALYQQSSYQDKLKNNTDFNINQFGLLYNISL